jgi:hypothetical protein
MSLSAAAEYFHRAAYSMNCWRIDIYCLTFLLAICIYYILLEDMSATGEMI